ncbi:hypothetical protein KC332_g17193 [Hortaea werneckii]|uniref:Uncharacterized protein n=2 Tax=Hortaea werneckii TaxID=91943 RepID=A0A3M7I827_HORWE|nr:hypothetical protein KC350_g17945 [Hortaea werneckii]OTA24189.1 hypothetical protein BTJ68_11669 [Hortaea werneckii EXF-2000]KAI6793272.1 hypothetical protein KC358_g17407 [Hortaea werneckii]KAI6898378.1 hypothetical protein KC348_g17461 [Hortaea werneckii]KAI6918324.1 hypothetical protein KC341_g17964 [Hortaea werneckii]
MSDSEGSETGTMPDEASIEQCLRRTVRDAIKSEEEVTVNSTRIRVEEQLGLGAGFFKGSDEWKQRSKEVISAAVVEPDSPVASKTGPKPKPQRGSKRKSEDAEDEPRKGRGQKRAKKSATPASDAEESEPEEDEEQPSVKPKPNPRLKNASKGDNEEQPKPDENSDLSEPPEENAPDQDASSQANGKPASADDESEMSEVLDEPPAKRKRQKKPTSPSESKPKTTKKSTAKPAVKGGKDLTADEEEIKRLQGQLLKCGIRKVWGKELKRFDTDKAKIKHLKSMLEDVGMTGRFSAEKAKQIKEQRELAAELESAKEFNETWGSKRDGERSEEEEEEAPTRSRGLKPKGLVDFGDSGDEGSD